MESFTTEICEGMQHMSESVFVGMCKIVGNSQQVAIRREKEEILEKVQRLQKSNRDYITMLSGSCREGFEHMPGSDFDYMMWPNNHKVIIDMSQSEYYDTLNVTLIFSDSSRSPPGFTLLQLLTPTTNKKVISACVRLNNDNPYISSSKFTEQACSYFFPNSTVHGPSSSGEVVGAEYDFVLCFACDFWPPSASSWINRSQSWPGPEVVNDIVRSGCNFVAIGHPLGQHPNEEWRISYSQAEYKCVSAMNHCQFMTYGLLKLFLKEVLNQQSEETNSLLCSYHIKTAVFWVIQQNILPHWGPQNILAGFWVCFKLLLRWVYEGICPNFFIPQNNMFLAKVYGSAQKQLFVQLHKMYKKGLACLLQSSSIRLFIIDVLCDPKLFICTNESTIRSEVDYDIELLNVTLCNYGIKSLQTIENLLGSPMTQHQIVTIQALTANTFLKIAFQLQNMYTSNKLTYIADKVSCHMLKLAAKFGCVSDMVYIAMYYYKTFRYMKALSVLEVTKSKLAQPYLMYKGIVDRERYTEVLGGQPWSSKMKQAVAHDLEISNFLCYINELIPEQQSSLLNNFPELHIPVFVMIHFLEFLCYTHVDALTLSQAALDDLQVLLHNDLGRYVFVIYRDISWQILGICQQLSGNLQAALASYQEVFRHYPWNRIQNATQMRMHDALQLIFPTGMIAFEIRNNP